uniref:CortBP2 domain-containing protein n=1 Tax=Steinernema glaseri TaxID=37863 RepID=A0A1I7YF74_9BILA
MSSEVRLLDAASVEALLSGTVGGGNAADFSRDHLLRLLAYLEGELQAKDIALNALKAERTTSALYQAKYGRLGANDPFLALQRDAVICGEELNETAISNMYESQLTQLEKLIAVQRRCQTKSKQALIAVERRHARVIRELEKEKQRSVADAAHGDDLCALLDNERTKLKQQLDYQQKECTKLKKDLALEAQKLAMEKEKHKKIVLFLINERKQILLKMHELRLKAQNDLSGPPEGGVIDELRKEILSLREERDHLTSQMKQLSMENTSLKEVVRTQEEDLTLIRQNILSNTRQQTDSLARVDDDCAIIANKGASTSGIPSHFMPKTTTAAPNTSKLRLSNSSSFPSSTRSRVSSANMAARGTLPTPGSRTQPSSLITNPNVRAHSSTSTMRPASAHSSIIHPNKASSNPSSPIKKIPAPMTTTQLGTRRPQALQEPEIEQLGAVIESMGAPTRNPMVTKRSASLPRHNADNSPSGLPKSVSATKAAAGSATMSRKNGLLKGFGVGRSLVDKSRSNS